MYILGISSFYHDSAACLIKNGKILAAAQEERFTRKKHDFNFPKNAVEYCLKEADISIDKVKYVSFYDKPILKFERILETYSSVAPKGFMSFIKAIPMWLHQKLWIPRIIRKTIGFTGKIIFPEHHESHAASAFYPSPFNKAAIITTDGVGEWTTTSIGIGENNNIKIVKELHFPHSLGLLYSAFTYYTGFKVNSGEYKVMGLAPYGEPEYVDIILDKLVDLKEDGSFKMNMDYFGYLDDLKMTNNAFSKLFGQPPRKSETKLVQKEMDLARSVQDVTEIVMNKIAKHARNITNCENLCMAGGVSLNCVANGKILRKKIFNKIWIQPAAGDAGGAVGAAMLVWHKLLNKERISDNINDKMKGAYLGPEFSETYIQNFLDKNNIKYEKLNEEDLCKKIAEHIDNEKVIGHFNGKMEFGPRALGNRSIIGDPRSTKMQSIMNLKIKFRESFRPFAPSVLREDVNEYFEMDSESPYMLLVADVKENKRIAMTDNQKKLFGIDKLNIPRSSIPAITHVDYSARVQTVDGKYNSRYYRIINEFKKLTNCSVIINTSFNVRGEPIVCSPENAFKCFMRTDMDYLVIGNYMLNKEEMKPLENDDNWKEEFELD